MPRAASTPPSSAQRAGGYSHYDIAALARQRDYQAEIERASALLCSVQPDLVAGEVIPVQSVTSMRSRWPVLLLVAATALFWAGVAWFVASLI